MNILSWFIYMADVVDTLQKVVLGTLGLAIVGSIIWLIKTATYNSDCAYHSARTPLPYTPALKSFMYAGIVAFVLVFIPSKQTMYAIAASELGQKAFQSELGQRIVNTLESWVKKQL